MLGISMTEIILILIGCLAIIVGFVLPSGPGGREDELDADATRKDVQELVRHSVEAARQDIRNRIEDTLEESLLKTERNMERMTNEKMSAISDYADTVMTDIHKNHDEVMFMYDMLNDKHKNLTGLVSEVTQTAKDAKQTVLDAQLTAKTAKESTARMQEGVRAPVFEHLSAADIARPRTAASAQSGGIPISAILPDNPQGMVMPAAAGTQQAVLPAAQAAAPAPGQAAAPAPSARQAAAPAVQTSEAQQPFAALSADSVSKIEPEMVSNRIIRSERDIRMERARQLQDLTEFNVYSESDNAAARAAETATSPFQGKVVSIESAQQKLNAQEDGYYKRNAEASGGAVYMDSYLHGEDRQQAVLRMHNEGMSHVAIARELNMGVGEVRLMIDMMSKHRRIKRG